MVATCLKKRLMWLQSNDQSVESDVEGTQQYLEIPQAIANSNGLHQKWSKCNVTACYEKKYGTSVIRNEFPQELAT